MYVSFRLALLHFLSFITCILHGSQLGELPVLQPRPNTHGLRHTHSSKFLMISSPSSSLRKPNLLWSYIFLHPNGRFKISHNGVGFTKMEKQSSNYFHSVIWWKPGEMTEDADLSWPKESNGSVRHLDRYHQELDICSKVMGRITSMLVIDQTLTLVFIEWKLWKF